MEEKEKGEEERRKEGKEGICKTRAKKKKKKVCYVCCGIE